MAAFVYRLRRSAVCFNTVILLCLVIIFLQSLVFTRAVSAYDEDQFTRNRNRLVDYLETCGISDPEVLRAMRTVPRHRFVLAGDIYQAYVDTPLGIGHGQTISQPYIVALMTELLEVDAGSKVLEIGTGSGYQAAVLAEIVDEVYTIEIIDELAERSTKLLTELGYTNIRTMSADGYYGWESEAPFDAIIVTAAARDHVPHPLIQQLKDGGRIVIPIGPPGAVQTLWRFTKRGDTLDMENWGLVRFVPLVRK
jgi:protein-L-isoaspartate(D-aspartate) O-methyltransferase